MERTTRPWQRLSGWGMAFAVLAWIAFRLYSRLSVEPYIDFRAFYEAAEAARTGGDPYVPVFGMYIYPPMLAAWMSPLSLLPQTAAAWVWFALGMAVSLLALHLTWKALRERFGFPAGAGSFGVVLGLVLVFGMTQTRWEFEHGNATGCCCCASASPSPPSTALRGSSAWPSASPSTSNTSPLPCSSTSSPGDAGARSRGPASAPCSGQIGRAHV